MNHQVFTHKTSAIFIALATTLMLTACGGSSSDSTSSNNKPTTPTTPTPSVKNFSDTATWTVDTTTIGTTCYDFDTKAKIDCSNPAWDIKFDNQARGNKLWTNGGTSGSGKGGALGLIDWQSLKTYKNALQDPVTGRDLSQLYQVDKSAGVFDEKPWYEYNLQGSHQLYPNNRVYLITTDNTNKTTASSVQLPVYALQITNYYDNTGRSGYPTIRYIDTAMPNQVKTQTINASSATDWVYVNLATGETFTSPTAGNWQIAFNRMNVKLNGGDSGTGKVGGYLAKTPTGFYDTNNQPIIAKFITDNSQTTLADLTNTAGFEVASTGVTWVIDKFNSMLNPLAKGAYPNLDFGWYTYNGATHQMTVKPDASAQGALIRSNTGDSYARIKLTQINYATAGSPQASSYVYQLDIQPR